MKYNLEGKKIEKTNLQEHLKNFIEIINESTFEMRLSEKRDTLQGVASTLINVRYCKVDIYEDYIAGAFLIPNKHNVLNQEICIRYYLSKDFFVFVDETGKVREYIEQFSETQIMHKASTVHFLFEFMEFLIREDISFFQQYEIKMTAMEDEILTGKIGDFNEKLLKIRKELLRFYTYYHQLADISEIIEENANEMLTQEECRLFGMYANRVDRLYDHIQMLKEYSLQVREMYQSHIDIRQNQIMKFLTVVTTIFMPLTLIAGWYGMNFINMPELQFRHGYFIVAGVSILITVLQIWIFKIKKWF